MLLPSPRRRAGIQVIQVRWKLAGSMSAASAEDLEKALRQLSKRNIENKKSSILRSIKAFAED
jgi:hypothetical protein